MRKRKKPLTGLDAVKKAVSAEDADLDQGDLDLPDGVDDESRTENRRSNAQLILDLNEGERI